MIARLLFILCILSSCYVSDEVAPDQNTWEYGRPGKSSLSEEALLTVNTKIKNKKFQLINGVIIIKDDKLVYENYYNQKSRSYQQSIGQASLSFTVTALGIAEDQRKLSLDDPIHTYLPDYKEVFDNDPNKKKITINHLLTHKSGFSWNEAIFSAFSLENDLNILKTTDDWLKYILEKPLEAPAGFRFNLNTASGIILAKIIENATGETFEDFLYKNLLTPLSIDSISIEKDATGNFNGGTGVSISLIDWTKLGYLTLKKGLWEGRKVVNPNFIDSATSVQVSVSKETFNIGYGWRLFGEKFAIPLGVPSNEIIYFPGEIGQYLYIIPSKNMIVSIFAENFFFRFQNPSLNLFTEISFALQ